jgi:hypothetical protein
MRRKRGARKMTVMYLSEPAISQTVYNSLPMNARRVLSHQLMPLGILIAIAKIQRGVLSLAGERYIRNGNSKQGMHRYGSNPGSVKLDGYQILVKMPPVRGSRGEIPLKSQERIHLLKLEHRKLLRSDTPLEKHPSKTFLDLYRYPRYLSN